MTTYKCPQCGSRELNVTVQCWAQLIQTGADDDYVFETELDDGDHEWDSESAMTCRDCRRGGKVSDFTIEEEEELTNAD